MRGAIAELIAGPFFLLFGLAWTVLGLYRGDIVLVAVGLVLALNCLGLMFVYPPMIGLVFPFLPITVLCFVIGTDRSD